MPQFSMRYCSKSLVLRTNSSKLGFVTMFLQVCKCFFCGKTNRRSLLWVEFGICIGRESSNVLNKICLFETCTFSLWYSLTHLKVLKENSFDSWQYKRCVQLNVDYVRGDICHQRPIYILVILSLSWLFCSREDA